MSNFVPEMHDFAKLIAPRSHFPTGDGTALKYHVSDGASFRNVDWNALGQRAPGNATWLGMVYHMDIWDRWVRDLSKSAPDDLHLTEDDRVKLFLTVLSDHLAATSGRVLRGRGGKREACVYRLWYAEYADQLQTEPEPICDVPSLKKALAFVGQDPASVSEFTDVYGDHLKCRAEDKGIPRNVTSLLSHSMLSGQFYRVLDGTVTRLSDPLRLSLGGLEVTQVYQAEQKWTGQFVRATVRMHQNPVRSKDLRVFRLLDYLHTTFARDYRDHLLFFSADTLWLFFAGDAKEKLPKFLSTFTDSGFYVETLILDAPLGELDIRFDALAPRRKKRRAQKVVADPVATSPLPASERLDIRPVNFYPGHFADQPAFDPPLCEICQVRPGKAHSSRTVTDYVCDVCFNIRSGASFQQRDLDDWLLNIEDEERGTYTRGQILWAQLSLDPTQLEQTARELFGLYSNQLKQGPDGQLFATTEWDGIQRNLRLPALLRDFVQDYWNLLAEFRTLVQQIVGGGQFEVLSDDSVVAMVKDGKQVYRLLSGYLQLAQRFFPSLTQSLAIDAPVHLGLSIAPAKYPFYQHRRYTSTVSEAVNIQIVGKEPLEVSLPAAVFLTDRLGDLTAFDWAARNWRTYLHKLAAVAARSGSTALATTTFISDLDGRGRMVPQTLHDFKEPLRRRLLYVTDLLAYAKVTTWK